MKKSDCFFWKFDLINSWNGESISKSAFSNVWCFGRDAQIRLKYGFSKQNAFCLQLKHIIINAIEGSIPKV